MKVFLILLLSIGIANVSFSQIEPIRERKVVMQLTSPDTMVYKSLLIQLKNLREADPMIEIEVVCHGPGMNFLKQKNETKLASLLTNSNGHLTFIACENTMREKNITKEELATNIQFVKAGILEIIDKQQDGWAYTKAGF
jgi:uncharacterized protein